MYFGSKLSFKQILLKTRERYLSFLIIFFQISYFSCVGIEMVKELVV